MDWMDIQKGDFVVCVNKNEGDCENLQIGKEYLVSGKTEGGYPIRITDPVKGLDAGWHRISLFEKTQKGGIPMVKNLKEYFSKHQDTIITIAFITLLDHFLFNGALRIKIQETVEKILGQVSKTKV